MLELDKQVVGCAEKSHLTIAQKRRFPGTFQVQNVVKMGLSDNLSFQAGCQL